MLVKSCPLASLKAVGDPAEGVFEAIVSVFGNKDSYGDVVVEGAFVDTLAEWKASGDPIPVYWSHRMDDPDFNVGYVLDAKEVKAAGATPAGLWIRGQIDLDAPKAAQVHRLMKGRRVTQFSFAYDVLDSGWAKSEELGEYLELRRLHVHEVGPTPIGANQSTELLAVKSATAAAQHALAGVKAGRVLSTKNETTLRNAYEAIGTVLAAVAGTDEDQEKASGTGPAKDEEPRGAKSEEPSRNPSVENLARSLQLADLAI